MVDEQQALQQLSLRELMPRAEKLLPNGLRVQIGGCNTTHRPGGCLAISAFSNGSTESLLALRSNEPGDNNQASCGARAFPKP